MAYCVVFGCCVVDKTRYEKDGRYFENFGGKGGNQAIALARAGVKSVILTKLSSIKEDLPSTKAHIKNLRKNKVNTKYISYDPKHKNDFTNVTVAPNGDNTLDEVIDISQHFDKGYVESVRKVIEGAEFAIFQMKVPSNTTRKLIEICRKAGVKTVLTPCRTQKTRENMDIIENVDYITCNEKEANEIFGKEGKLTPKELSDILKKYPNKLIVTLGKKCVMYHDGKKVYKVPAIKVENVLDTTGAGDTFCGNFVASLVCGDDLHTAVKKGICASTIKIQSHGTQTAMPRKKERDKLYNEIYKEKAND